MTRVFKYSNIQFAIELDLFENYVDKPIDVLSKDWHKLALELHGENEQIRNTKNNEKHTKNKINS